MHRFRLAIVVATVVAAGAAVSTAGAAFSGNVCSLLSANQVATVHVAPLKCTAEKTVHTSIFTAYHGYWGKGVTSPGVLLLGCNTGNAAYLKVAKTTLRTLPGVPIKVSGIGSVAYEVALYSHGTRTTINFVVGGYICAVTLWANKALKSITTFNTLAKAVAAKL
jgi:hypothetical protein